LFVLYSGASAVCATVDVQGDAASVQVVARRAPLSEVLVALSRKVEIRYDAMVKVDSVVENL
jgi:predicted RNase H-like nuclease